MVGSEYPNKTSIISNHHYYMIISRKEFDDEFKWGVSTAAYQIEGAHLKHGKGQSIWDKFTQNTGNVLNGHNANESCDFYHLFEDDLELMSKMNIQNFRMSISWARIIPKGIGQVNNKGIDFYRRIFEKCHMLGIQPWVTLYHWDLPHELEIKGGWTNRDIVNWFLEFVQVCVDNFGDLVDHWMVLNEPMVFVGAGYFLGVHAPGKKGLKSFLPAVHHATLCQSLGGKLIKSAMPNATVGTTFSCSHIEPRTHSKRDIVAAKKVDALLNRLFIEPSLGFGYPIEDVQALERIEKYFKADDECDMKFDFDFIGIQNYTREIVKHSYFVPLIKAKLIKAEKRTEKVTLMGWEVYPPSIYNMLKKFNQYEGINKLIVTENGAAFQDEIINNQVPDDLRVNYLKDHIAQVLRAKNDGVKVDGYFVWTFMDNFEWAEGYVPRFGLVYVDFKTKKRIIKSSGEWYKTFLSK